MTRTTGLNLSTISQTHEKLEGTDLTSQKDLLQAHQDRGLLLTEVKRLRHELETYDLVMIQLEKERQEHDETRGYRQLAEQDRDDAQLELEKLKAKLSKVNATSYKADI